MITGHTVGIAQELRALAAWLEKNASGDGRALIYPRELRELRALLHRAADSLSDEKGGA